MEPKVQVADACRAIGITRSMFYRSRRPQPKTPPRPRPTPERALSAEERNEVLKVLNSPEFVDVAPEEVFAVLLDEGHYLCSARTMYRILEDHQMLKERRNQRTHPKHPKPELKASSPNKVWSWDVTKLKGPAKWSFFYLYVILDIFSRYVVGWMVAERETATLAKRLIKETISKYDLDPTELMLHSDRGPAQRAKLTVQLLADLGLVRSYGRPRTPNDNPFSESQFKTMKYRPDFPDRFGSIEDVKAFCSEFFEWYNREHRHSGIGFMTPHDVHFGLAEAKHEARQRVLMDAYLKNPERFVNGPPTPPEVPEEVWINGPAKGVMLTDI
jgi:putative transposase